MKSKSSNSYRSILRGTSFFGGVQVFQVLINLVGGKLVAMLLGSAGMGVSALFVSSSTTIQRFVSIDLNLAIVKETSSHASDEGELVNVISVARRLVTVTALAGALLCVLFSSLLSRFTFGDETMSSQFILLGIVVGLTVAYNGKLAILQGIQEVKRISLASLVGGLAGLAFGVPLYYFWGIYGIVPAMGMLALTMYIFYSISLSRAVKLPSVRFVWNSHKHLIKTLVVLGLLLMVNDMLVSLVQYLINIFIKMHGSTDAVGLYQSANSLTNQYSGMVFTAMSMDFFPRLSKVISDNKEMRSVVNRQSEIVALIIAPASGLLIFTAPFVIRLLLTVEFLPIVPLMRWMGLGILIRALTFPMGYIAFAKGNRRIFFWMEGILCNGLTLIYSCIFYHFWGLIGLGYALVADNFTCLLIYYIVNHRLYDYSFDRNTLLYYITALVSGVAIFATSFIASSVISYLLMGTVLLIVILWSFTSLRRLLKK